MTPSAPTGARSDQGWRSFRWPEVGEFARPPGIPVDGARLRLRIIVDTATVEIFGDRGQAYAMFTRSNPGGFASLELRTISKGGEVHVEKLSGHSLTSAWTTA